MTKRAVKGKLEVICGSMFSGKSEELIRRIRRVEFAHAKAAVFKHKIDNRISIDYITSHGGDKYKAIAIDTPSDMELFVSDSVQLIAVDEVHFFGEEIVPVIMNFIDQGKRIIVAGLDLDFRGIPFGCMPTLLSIANTVIKLNAICAVCGDEAIFTQRLINGRAAKFDDPLILIGAQDCYQARCRDCYIIDKPAWNEAPVLSNIC